MKAQLCVKGHALLTAYLQERGLPFWLCGKLIVASTQPLWYRVTGPDQLFGAGRRSGAGFVIAPAYNLLFSY
jgi:hypothetical protein